MPRRVLDSWREKRPALQALKPLPERVDRPSARLCARVSGSAPASGGVAWCGALFPPDVLPPRLSRRVSMATGRGRLLRQLCLGLQALHLPLGGLVAAPGSGGFR